MYDRLSIAFAVVATVAAGAAYVGCESEAPSARERREAIELRCWQGEWAETYAAQAAYLEGREQ